MTHGMCLRGWSGPIIAEMKELINSARLRGCCYADVYWIRLTGKGRAGSIVKRKKERKGVLIRPIRERWSCSRRRREREAGWPPSESKLTTPFSSTPSISSLIHSFPVHVYRPRSLLFPSMVVSRFCPLFFRVRLLLPPHSTTFLIDF